MTTSTASHASRLDPLRGASSKKERMLSPKSPDFMGFGGSLARAWLLALFLVAAGLIVYANNYDGEFNFDDFDTVVDNPVIQTLPLFWASLLSGPESPNTPLSGRPVVALSFALNFAAGGLDVRGYHLVNNLIHILAGLALFGLIRHSLLLPRFIDRFGPAANGYALVVALLWLVHPLQTEAVDYLTQRTEIMMGLFYLLTLFGAAGGLRSPQPRGWYGLAVGSCLLGMGCKEVMVSAPVVVLLYDRLLVAGSFRGALGKRRGFYLALAATWAALVFFLLNSSRAATVRFDIADLSPLDYFRTQLEVVLHYLRLVFWPWPLVLDSQDWLIVREFSAALLLPGAILGALLALTVYGLRRGVWWSLLGAYFFLTLAPSSSLLPVYTEIVAERRMYLPLAAVIVLVVFLVDAGGRRLWKNPAPLRQGVSLAGVAVLAVGLGTLTWRRNLDYRTAVGLWEDSVAKRPGNSRAFNNLGEALVREGRFAEAIGPFKESARLKSGDGEVHSYSNLGATLAKLGQFEEAIAAHRKALELTPDDAVGHYNLGNALLAVNDLAGAIDSFKQAIALNPKLYPAQGNLGLLLMQQGDLAGAEGHLQVLLQLAPQQATGYMFLAELRVKQGRLEEAIALLRQALTLQPDSQEIADRLATALANRDRQ